MANDIKLQSEAGTHPLDENLRPLIVGDKVTPLELSDTDVKVNNLVVSGTTDGVSASDPTKLPLAGGTMTGDLEMGSNDVTTTGAINTPKVTATGDLSIVAPGYDVSFTASDLANLYAQLSGHASESASLALYPDGAGSHSTFLTSGADGLTTLSTNDATGANAHINIEPDGHVEFDGCGVGFDLVTPAYDATTTVVDFKTGNKQFVTFGSGNITNIEFHFPATSGNFVCLFKQDGTGSRTITNYKAYDAAGNAAAGSSATKFAGGSNPTLTTDANHVDIISIFWDADNEIAYGVASLDFQF